MALTKQEQLEALGRVREFLTDVRNGKISVLAVGDVLMDVYRLEAEVVNRG